MRPVKVLKRWMICGVVAGSGIANTLVAEWIKLEADTFVIMSDESEASVREYAKEYAGFREAARALFSRPGVAAPKSLIILHSEHKDFMAYASKEAENKWIVPFSASTEVDGRATTVMTRGANWSETKRRTYEFDTMWLLRRYGWSLPIWMSQGSGIVLSTTLLEKDQKVVVGGVKNFADVWMHRSLIPWERFFSIGLTSPEYWRLDSEGIYHSQAWGLMHWLLLRDDRGADRFVDLANRLNTEAWSMAVVEAAGVDLGNLEREIHQHLRGRTPKREFPFDAKAVERSFVVTPLAEAELLAIQSDVAALVGRTDVADILYLRAVQLAPDAPSTLEAGARWMRRRGELAGAIDKYRAAIAAGSDNAYAYLASADFRLNRSGSDRVGAGLPIVLEPAELEVRRALELDPGLGEAYQLLGRIAYLEPEPDESKVEILSRRVGPDHWGIQARYLRALLLDRLGRDGEAMADFQWIIQQTEVDANTRTTVQARLDDRRLKTLRDAVRPLLESGSYEQALAAIDDWEATQGQESDGGTIRSLRERVADEKQNAEQVLLDQQVDNLNQKIKAKQFAEAQKAARDLKGRAVSETLRLAFARLAEQVDEIATLQLMRAANRAENWPETIRLAEEYLPTASADSKFKPQIEAALAETRSHR